MMRCSLIPCLVAAAFLSGCEKTNTAAPVEFYDQSLGWTFVIPPGWEEFSESEIDAVRDRGLTIMAEALETEIADAARPVLFIRIDDIHRFSSEAAIHNPQTDGSYLEAQREIFQDVRISIDHEVGKHGILTRHREGEAQIDGIKFANLSSQMLSEDEKTILFTTEVFDALIGDTGFLMSYTCQLKSRCEEIRSAIINSKFDKR